MKADIIDKAIPLLLNQQYLTSAENTELVIEALLQVKHFYTLIRYESQKQYLIDFLKKMTVQQMKSGQILYEKNSANEGLYIIVKGQLSLWQPKTHAEINGEIQLITKIQKFKKVPTPTEDMKNKLAEAEFRLNFLRNKEHDDLFRNQKASFFLTENICALKRIRNVQSGDSLNDDCVVSGVKTDNTVMAMSDCILLHISQRDYLAIFDLEIVKLNFIMDVLMKNFGNSNIDSVRRLAYKFKEEVVPYGSMVFHQDDPSNLFIIVRSGAVEISKSVNPDIPQLASTKNDANHDKSKRKSKLKGNSESYKDENPNEGKQEKTSVQELQQSQGNAKKNLKKKGNLSQEDEDAIAEYEKYYGTKDMAGEGDEDDENEDEGSEGLREFHKHGRKNKKRVRLQQQSVLSPVRFSKQSQCLRLGVIGAGQVVGLEDFIRHKPRSFQAKSIAADTVIYYVTKKKIDDIIDMNEDFSLKRSMRDNGRAKSDWYEQQQGSIAQIQSVQDQQVEDRNTVSHAKARFNPEDEVDFKSVVRKLFSDRRDQILFDMNKKQANALPVRKLDLNPIPSPAATKLSLVVTPHQIAEPTQKLDFNSLFGLYEKKFATEEMHKDGESHVPESKKAIVAENSMKHNAIQMNNNVSIDQEYERRFQTIHDEEIEENKQKSKFTKLQRFVMDPNHDQIEELELLRNYKLETSALSQKQKLQYKIKSNEKLASRYKKYNAETSKGFIEAKRFVKLLRGQQVSKSLQQGDVIASLREERLLNQSHVANKAKGITGNRNSEYSGSVDQLPSIVLPQSVQNIPNSQFEDGSSELSANRFGEQSSQLLDQLNGNATPNSKKQIELLPGDHEQQQMSKAIKGIPRVVSSDRNQLKEYESEQLPKRKKAGVVELPEIYNVSQLRLQNPNLKPSISFSVKMSRKNINQKFNDAFASATSIPNYPEIKMKQERFGSDSSISVNRLQVSEELREKILLRDSKHAKQNASMQSQLLQSQQQQSGRKRSSIQLLNELEQQYDRRSQEMIMHHHQPGSNKSQADKRNPSLLSSERRISNNMLSSENLVKVKLSRTPNTKSLRQFDSLILPNFASQHHN